jgi:hypothetical protein
MLHLLENRVVVFLRQRWSIMLTCTLGISPAVLVGRMAAACLHPYAAFRVLPRSTRYVVISAYVLAGYIAVLSTLFAL